MPPLERYSQLRPLSHEHQEALQLCWRIGRGLKNGVDTGNLMEEVRAFHRAHLVAHFAVEEKVVFPVLGADDPLVMRALADHRRLTVLFLNEPDALKALTFIKEELQAHVRFEERVLFQRVQEVASTAQLEHIQQVHGALVHG